MKYYIRTNCATTQCSRLESDRSIVTSCTYDYDYGNVPHTFSIEDHKKFLCTIAICLNVAIMVVGICITQEASSIKVYITKLGSKKAMSIMFWSTSVVLSILNIGWIAFNMYVSSIFNILYIKLNLVLILFFMIFEIITVHLLTQKIAISTRICCITKPMIVRAFQTYAICSIIWFAHRVGIWFIVSIYFIAASPSQTSAFIALCSSIILTCIIIIAVGVHSCYSSSESKIKIVFKIIMLVVFFLSISIVFVLFTFIFVDLTQHGLSSFGIGSIILSLILPFATLAITFVVKRYLKKGSSKEVNEEHHGYIEIQDNGMNELQQ